MISVIQDLKRGGWTRTGILSGLTEYLYAITHLDIFRVSSKTGREQHSSEVSRLFRYHAKLSAFNVIGLGLSSAVIAVIAMVGASVCYADDGTASSVDYAQLGQEAQNGDASALAKLTTDANAGVLDAEYQLGFYYYQNLDYFHAAPWLEKAGDQKAKQGDIQTAIGYYDIASYSYSQNQQNNKAAELYVKLGDLNYGQTGSGEDYLQDYQAALSAWQNAVQLEPTLLDAQIRLMNANNDMAQLNSSNWPGVINLANKVLQLDPKNADAYRIRAGAIIGYMTGSAGGNMQEFAQVISDLKQAVQIDPANADNTILLARAYLLEAGFEQLIHNINADQAIGICDQALQIMQDYVNKYPDNPKGWLDMASLCDQIPGMESSVQDAINKALTISPNDPDALAAQLNELIKYKSLPGQIGEAIEKLIAVQPDHMNNYMIAAEYYAGLGDNVSAIKYLKAALDHPTPGGGVTPFQNAGIRQSVYELLADVYMNAADLTSDAATRNDYLNKASDAISWVQTQQLDAGWVYVNQGRLYTLHNQYDAALQQLKGADSILSPTNAQQVHLWLLNKEIEIQVYTALGQNDQAARALDQIDRYFPDQPVVLINRARLELQQNPSAALAAVDEFLNQDSSNQEALGIKAQALAALGQTTELNQVLDSIQNLTLPLAELKTRLELLNGDNHAAWQTIQPWVQQNPADPRVVTPAYAALAGIGDRTQAAELIAQALKDAPDNTQYLLLNNELAKSGNSMPQLSFDSLTSDVVHIAINGENPDQTQLAAINQISDPVQRSVLLTDFYLDRGQLDQAGQAIQAAEQAAPNNHDVIEAQFRLDLAEEDFDAASAVISRADELNIDGLNGDLYQARLDLARNGASDALDLLSRDLQTHPNDIEAQAYKGQALLASGKGAQGTSELEAVLKLQPNNLVALRTLVNYYMRTNTQDSLEQARDLINQGLGYYPLDYQLQQFSGDVADLLDDPQQRINTRLAAYKANPGDMHNVECLAQLYSSHSQLSEAISLLNTAFRAHPDSLDLAQMLVTLYLKQKDVGDAQDVLEQLAENGNSQIAFMGRIMLGDLYLKQGLQSQAAQMYLQAQDAMPADKAIVESRLGDMYFNAGDYSDALKFYGPLYATDSKNRDLAIRYIQALIKNNQADQALNIIDNNLLAQNPSDEQAMELKGEALLAERKLPEALDVFNNTLTLNSQDMQALYNRASVYLAFSPPEYQQAIGDLLVVENIDAKNYPARLLLAQTYEANRQYAEAVHEYQQVIALDPDDQTIRLRFAQLLFDLASQLAALSPDDNSDLAASLRIIDPVGQFQNLVQDSLNMKMNNLEYAQWLALYGQYDMETGNVDEGIALTRKAYDAAGETPEAALAYLRVLLTAGKYEEAVDVAGNAIKSSPDNADFYVFRGRAYSMLQRFPQSHADFVQALTISMNNAKEFFQVLDLYQSASNDPQWLTGVSDQLLNLQKQYPDQATLFDTALAIVAFIEKDNQGALRFAVTALNQNPVDICETSALRIAAMAANNLNQYDQSKNYYLKLLKISPTDASACNNMAYLLASKFRDLQGALRYAQQANDLSAQQEGVNGYCHDANNLDTLGWIYYLTDDYSDAYDALEMSLKYNPPPVAYYHLGQVLVAQNNFSEAKQVLQEGLIAARQSNDPIADQIQDLLNSGMMQ